MSTSLSKQTVHSPFLLLDGSGGGKTGETGGLRGELGAVTARRKKNKVIQSQVWCTLDIIQHVGMSDGSTVGLDDLSGVSNLNDSVTIPWSIFLGPSFYSLPHTWPSILHQPVSTTHCAAHPATLR